VAEVKKAGSRSRRSDYIVFSMRYLLVVLFDTVTVSHVVTRAEIQWPVSLKDKKPKSASWVYKMEP
jgi:hypothetical protein